MFDTLAMAKELKDEYREVFETADSYGMLCPGGMEDYEEKLMNLYDILMEAQHEEKPVNKIVGKDIQKFCREYFAQEPDKKNIFIFKGIYNLALVVFIFAVWDTFVAQEASSDILPYISGMVIGFVLSALCQHLFIPLIFKNKKLSPLKLSFIVLALFIAAGLGCVWLCEKMEWEIMIGSKGLLLISGAYIFVYLLVKAVRNYRQHGKIMGVPNKEKKMRKEFNKELSKKAFEAELMKQLDKKFHKTNERNVKKGKPELTYREFYKKRRKEEIQVNRIYLGFVIANVLYLTVMEAVNNVLSEALIFGTILAVPQLLVWLLYRKASKSRIAFLETCETKGLTPEEYLDLQEASNNCLQQTK